MIRVFIGYDPSEIVSYHVLSHSILKHSSLPVSITPLSLHNLQNIMTRERNELQSTDFSFSRFIVPFLCGYEGRAIFLDCDMLFLDDIAKLWDLFDPNYSLQVVKHEHEPSEKVKFLGNKQLSYNLKNWSSVMLFHNEKCKNLTKDYVNTATGLELHQFKWLSGLDEVGGIPKDWNYLVDSEDGTFDGTIRNLHFTKGGPYFQEFSDCSYADEWWDMYRETNSCKAPVDCLYPADNRK